MLWLKTPFLIEYLGWVSDPRYTDPQEIADFSTPPKNLPVTSSIHADQVNIIKSFCKKQLTPNISLVNS